jgi:hypothetical protein
MIKYRRMRRAGHVALMAEKKNACRILVRVPEGNRPTGRINVGGRMIIKLIFERWDGVVSGS